MSTKFRQSRHRRRRGRRRNRLRLERLETRRLLATLAVTSTADVVDLNPGDGVCEVSVDGSCTLRAAIQEANALPDADGPDRILLPAGTYTLSLTGADDRGGDLDIRQSLVLEGAGPVDTIIDGAGIDRVIDVVPGTAATINGVTIRGGVIEDDQLTVEGSGGGIRNEGDLTVADSTIAGNAAGGGDRGGIRDASAGTSTTLQSVILSGNSASGVGPDLSSDAAAATFSLIQSGLRHSIDGGIDGNIVGQHSLLGPLADNGGPTLTHRLLEGSVAIDQGTNAGMLVGDQRGEAFVRTLDDLNISNASEGTDMGAVEVGQAVATFDFGDAPEGISVGATMRQYPTRLASDGARHRITEDGPSLGSLTPDAEPDAQSTASATGDDLVGVDDEDAFGSTTITLTPGESFGDLSISHNGGSTGALLNVWIDLNLDGDWDDTFEQFLTDVPVPAGASSTSLGNLTLPAGTPLGRTFIRVRISTETELTPRGEAMDGEVEDFAATIGIPPPQIADLSLTQIASDINPVLGQRITFTITVTNAGPDRATNIEVTSLLPDELIYVASNATLGQYDDLDGIWILRNLNAGASAVLNLTAIVDATDPITHTSEITLADSVDPDSTPGNGISGEDDQASVTLGTCLAGGPIHVGINRLTYTCASPGSISAFVLGTERGTRTFSRYGVTVDIADAEVFALAVADPNGVATALLELTDDEFARFFEVSEETPDPRLRVQAFEMAPASRKSNTLSLASTAEMLRAARVGPGALGLQPQVLPAVIDTAIATWDAVGVSATDLAIMNATYVTVSNLPGDAIALVAGNTIVLDIDAAGNGWFIDGTPWDDSEFSASGPSGQLVASDSEAAGRVDLVTALIHEFGHVIGLPDLSNPTNVMHGTLDVGARRRPTTNTNHLHRLDVNGDEVVSALDALIVINRLKRESVHVGSAQSVWVGARDDGRLYLDTNADFSVSALDALQVINHLGRAESDLAFGEAVDWNLRPDSTRQAHRTREENQPESTLSDGASVATGRHPPFRPAGQQSAPRVEPAGAPTDEDSKLLRSLREQPATDISQSTPHRVSPWIS